LTAHECGQLACETPREPSLGLTCVFARRRRVGLCPPPDDGSHHEPLNQGERPTDEHARDHRKFAAKKFWTSPGSKTPHATLFSSILRDINEKGKDARFAKTERRKFAANAG